MPRFGMFEGIPQRRSVMVFVFMLVFVFVQLFFPSFVHVGMGQDVIPFGSFPEFDVKHGRPITIITIIIMIFIMIIMIFIIIGRQSGCVRIKLVQELVQESNDGCVLFRVFQWKDKDDVVVVPQGAFLVQPIGSVRSQHIVVDSDQRVGCVVVVVVVVIDDVDRGIHHHHQQQQRNEQQHHHHHPNCAIQDPLLSVCFAFSDLIVFRIGLDSAKIHSMFWFFPSFQETKEIVFCLTHWNGRLCSFSTYHVRTEKIPGSKAQGQQLASYRSLCPCCKVPVYTPPEYYSYCIYCNAFVHYIL